MERVQTNKRYVHKQDLSRDDFRFNPLFNGNEAFRAGKLKIETSWPEAYDRILPVYKWPDEEMSAGIATDMDRAMEKAVKVITGHSMVIGGRQKNDYIDDNYMLIGLARFYKGEYFSATGDLQLHQDQLRQKRTGP